MVTCLQKLHSRLLLPLLLLLMERGLGQGSAFTYQGRLEDGGRPATGLYEIQFQVFDREVPSGIEVPSVPLLQFLSVTNGIFTTVLDFGDSIFNGADRYLELSVRPAGSLAPLEKLVPRQRITPTPYAMRAAGLVGTLPTNQLPSGVLLTDASGTLRGSIRATDSADVFAGDGSGLSGVQAAALGGRGEVRVQEAFYRRLETSERPGLP